jgi:hypothetical protein
MNYTDVIVIKQINDVRVTVLKGNLLDIQAVKVLPINEFFSIEDNDWRDASPRSVLGQYLKRLTLSEQERFQAAIDIALGRSRSEEGQIGYPYGWTILVEIENERVFLTNTVKYDMQAISANFSKMAEQTDEFFRKYFWAEEHRWIAPTDLIMEDEERWNKKQVHYDTFLLAIELCVEGIIKASCKYNVDKLVLPLLGAGWGGLDEKLVLRGLLAFIGNSIEEEANLSLKEITIVLPPKSTVDRQLVIRGINELPYGTCPNCGKYHDDKPITHRVRILEDELKIVEQQIEDYSGEVSSVLTERRKDLLSELEKFGVQVKQPKRQKNIGGRPDNEDNIWAREQIEYNRPQQEVYQEWLERRRKHGTLQQLVDPYDSFKKAIAQRGKKGRKRE